jgi:hypothetical protein
MSRYLLSKLGSGMVGYELRSGRSKFSRNSNCCSVAPAAGGLNLHVSDKIMFCCPPIHHQQEDLRQHGSCPQLAAGDCCDWATCWLRMCITAQVRLLAGHQTATRQQQL